ncbi:MAG: hypothetical protein PHQ23_14130 [Candidatus Wallbacteria bacterium]|nr:hypothetical protein [Candidatus Wallbacteria bacterium]
MREEIERQIAQNLHSFQSALIGCGSSLEEYIQDTYLNKWDSEIILAAMKIRTTMMGELYSFLTDEGLINIEKVLLSMITDPLAHDIEHTPSVSYKGQQYVTTHSMIYSKMLACINKKVKGIFVDSPNIRLELESPIRFQRGRYLIDFSQMDIEVRRNHNLSFEEYLNDPETVRKILDHDLELALNFFERMLVRVISRIVERNSDELAFLGVRLRIPTIPFPVFGYDGIRDKFGRRSPEKEIGKETDSQFFWVRGILRENYDLVYPYLLKDGSKVKREDITSDMIYNYDICAKSVQADGSVLPAVEILSGGVREWIYEAIIERLIDNKILPCRPDIRNCCVENIDEIAGYGPFLMIAKMLRQNGKPYFPETFGGGLGIERMLYAILRGPKIEKVDDVTFFGKNPDSQQLYLF